MTNCNLTHLSDNIPLLSIWLDAITDALFYLSFCHSRIVWCQIFIYFKIAEILGSILKCTKEIVMIIFLFFLFFVSKNVLSISVTHFDRMGVSTELIPFTNGVCIIISIAFFLFIHSLHVIESIALFWCQIQERALAKWCI